MESMASKLPEMNLLEALWEWVLLEKEEFLSLLLESPLGNVAMDSSRWSLAEKNNDNACLAARCTDDFIYYKCQSWGSYNDYPSWLFVIDEIIRAAGCTDY